MKLEIENEKKTSRNQKMLYLDTAIMALFEDKVGKGNVSSSIEQLITQYLNAEETDQKKLIALAKAKVVNHFDNWMTAVNFVAQTGEVPMNIYTKTGIHAKTGRPIYEDASERLKRYFNSIKIYDKFKKTKKEVVAIGVE